MVRNKKYPETIYIKRQKDLFDKHESLYAYPTIDDLDKNINNQDVAVYRLTRIVKVRTNTEIVPEGE